MGCNCGKKPKPLNNLKSNDHLKLASDMYLEIINKKTVEEYTDFDKEDIIKVYMSLYPNQKVKPTLDNAVYYITQAHQQYKS
jgi:hypothetical protein